MARPKVVERMDVRPDSIPYQEHQARYQFAQAYLKPGPRLDVATGTGYGTQSLGASDHPLVVGLDLYQVSLVAASQLYRDGRLAFVAGDGMAMPFVDGSFPTITSMETLEHVANDIAFVAELHRVLRPGGICILSTPNKIYSQSHKMVNPYHVREYTEHELRALLSRFFDGVQIFHQGFAGTYHGEVRHYAASIQQRKHQLSGWLRWAIDNLYKPAKKLVPASVNNYFIHKLLRLSYPQPSVHQIAITRDALEDCANFVVLCEKRAA